MLYGYRQYHNATVSAPSGHGHSTAVVVNTRNAKPKPEAEPSEHFTRIRNQFTFPKPEPSKIVQTPHPWLIHYQCDPYTTVTVNILR